MGATPMLVPSLLLLLAKQMQLNVLGISAKRMLPLRNPRIVIKLHAKRTQAQPVAGIQRMLRVPACIRRTVLVALKKNASLMIQLNGARKTIVIKLVKPKTGARLQQLMINVTGLPMVPVVPKRFVTRILISLTAKHHTVMLLEKLKTGVKQ